jgi:GNAT superfamily N-acetyltransferase
MQIRSATPKDVSAVLGLIRELAEYEHALTEVESTEQDLMQNLFAEKPAVYCEVVELDQQVVACAIWFLNYSTWQGRHGIYLEDLYVQPEHRGKGIGTALLKHLAAKCVENNWGRFQWSVLDWNQPSIDFYLKLGAQPLDEWTTYRVTGTALGQLAG